MSSIQAFFLTECPINFTSSKEVRFRVLLKNLMSIDMAELAEEFCRYSPKAADIKRVQRERGL